MGSGRISLVSRRYTLRCGPSGGTLPHPNAGCAAVADYLAHPPRLDTCVPPLGGRPTPTASITGTFAGHPIRIGLDAGSSWCGQSNAIMHDYWVLSDFPCVTQVVSAPGDSAPQCVRTRSGRQSRGGLITRTTRGQTP